MATWDTFSDAWQVHFDVPGCDFGVPGHHFVDPEAPKDTQQDTLGARLGFQYIFNGFWKPLGTNFGTVLVTFSSFGPPNGSTDSIVVFLLIWEQTWHQNATPGCFQNIVNTMVFVRFTV